MFRLINCVKKRADISDTEFREFWNSERYEGLVEEASLLFNVHSYKKSVYLHIELNEVFIHDTEHQENYDAIIEYWWKDKDSIPNFSTELSEQWRDKFLSFEEDYIDVEKSKAFFTDWDE